MGHRPETMRVVKLDEQADEIEEMAKDVRSGLLSEPKDLSQWPKHLYDAKGSRVFEEITEQPEYYQTGAELSVLREKAGEIIRRTGCRELVELGSGSASKTRALLDALIEASSEDGSSARYVPMDVSESTLRESCDEILCEYPDLEVIGYAGDFDRSLERFFELLPETQDARLFIFLGGTIGNFTPQTRRSFLQRVSSGLRQGLPQDHFLLRVDLVKDTRTLEAAYNDAAGVTARFNKNLLRVLNERLGADFDPGLFEYRASYDPEKACMEMWLYSKTGQEVSFERPEFSVSFAAGEGIRTEISAKFTLDTAARTFEDTGFDLLELYTDQDGLFGDALLGSAVEKPNTSSSPVTRDEEDMSATPGRPGAAEVAQLYSGTLEPTWDRTDTSARVERYVLRKILDSWLPQNPATVADIGGGNGKYAFELAARGYDVKLCDVTPAMVEDAKRRNIESGAKLSHVCEADARALPWRENSVDAALFLGPMYGIPDAEDRVLALREAARVTKPGGILFVQTLTRAGGLRALFTYGAYKPDEAGLFDWRRYLRTGRFEDSGFSGFLRHSVWQTAKEVRDEIQSADLRIREVRGMDGPAPDNQHKLATAPDDLVEQWGELAYEIGGNSALLSACDHVMFVVEVS